MLLELALFADNPKMEQLELYGELRVRSYLDDRGMLHTKRNCDGTSGDTKAFEVQGDTPMLKGPGCPTCKSREAGQVTEMLAEGAKIKQTQTARDWRGWNLYTERWTRNNSLTRAWWGTIGQIETPTHENGERRWVGVSRTNRYNRNWEVLGELSGETSRNHKGTVAGQIGDNQKKKLENLRRYGVLEICEWVDATELDLDLIVRLGADSQLALGDLLETARLIQVG